MTKKKSLLDRFGALPVGMPQADVEAILQFLYGAFDRRSARQTQIHHPYLDGNEKSEEIPQLTISDFCQWLQMASQEKENPNGAQHLSARPTQG